LVETARALLGAGVAAVIACDPDALAHSAPGAPTGRSWRGLFQVVLDASALSPVDRERLAAWLLTTGPRAQPLDDLDASTSILAEPLASGEIALLMALAPLIEGTPSALKRFHNSYRLARVGKGARPIVALCLAALLSPDSRIAKALKDSLWEGGEKYEDPAAPPDLVQASRAARAAEGKPIARADARAAWETARRYAPADF
jgi:hypothetical protein